MWLLDIFRIATFKNRIKELTESLEKEQIKRKELEDIKYSMDQMEFKDLKLEIKKLNEEKNNLQNLETEKRNIVESLNLKIINLTQSLETIEDDVLVASYGLYRPKYNFENSTKYMARIKEIRAKQKECIKNNLAVTYPNFSNSIIISGGKRAYKGFMDKNVKLVLHAFNHQCDNLIAKTKHDNVDKLSQKMLKIWDELNKLTSVQKVSITSDYVGLKAEELYLINEYEQKKQIEKEEQQKIKEELREQAKVEEEIKKIKTKVDKEETHFNKAKKDLKRRLDRTDDDDDKNELLTKISELEEKLKEIEETKKDIINREQNTRAGYVYIISNIGSFGENVYKIGMTKRLDPMDRISELSSASVPFIFDVHAMIFSNDAPKLESELHKAFDHKRVNRINTRKEFFNITLDEIEQVVTEKFDKTVEFVKFAEAYDFRKSQTIEQVS